MVAVGEAQAGERLVSLQRVTEGSDGECFPCGVAEPTRTCTHS